MGLKVWLHGFLRPQSAQPIVPDYVVERVGRGAALLDAHKPDWALQVLPEYIDLASENACVLGQVYGTFGRGYLELRPHMAASPANGPQTVLHGFCVTELPDLPLLKAEWGRVIDERVRAHFASA